MAQAAPLAGPHCPMVAVPRPAAARKLRLLNWCKDGRTSIEVTSVGSSAGKHLQLRSAYRAQRQEPLPLRFAPNVSVRASHSCATSDTNES